MKIIGIIPARHGSSRLPGKALAKIGDHTMIQRVFDRASRAERLSEVWVATDHPDIEREVREFGGKVVMTSTAHQSGTDRCREALATIGTPADFVINIQGDEPFIDPAQIDLLAEMCAGETEIATLIQPVVDEAELFNPNVVKVVINRRREALYFSRATIPAHRDLPAEQWLEATRYFKHIGMYAYRSDVLENISQLPQGSLEKAESLEQLRWLEAGFRIRVEETDIRSFGIDTQEDLERARAEYLRMKDR